MVTGRHEACDRGRCDVEPARFEHHWNHGETAERVVRGCFRRFPKAVMGGQIPITGTKRAQPPIEQRKVHRFIGADPHPVIDEFARVEIAKPADHIEGEVDGGKLDMRQRMQHCDAVPLRASPPTLRHRRGGQEVGARWPRGSFGHGHIETVVQLTPAPGPGGGAGGPDLEVRLRRQQNRASRFADRGRKDGHHISAPFTPVGALSQTSSGLNTLGRRCMSFLEAINRDRPLRPAGSTMVSDETPNASARDEALDAYDRGAEDAVGRLSEALRHQPYDGGLLIAEARMRMAAGDPKATERLQAMLRAAPDWLDGHVALAQLRWEAGQSDIFLAEFEAALERLPSHAGLWFRYINAIAGSGASMRAADVARRLRSMGGDGPALRLIEAHHAGMAGNLDRAGALLASIPEEYPDKLPEEARHRLRLGDPAGSAATLDRLRSIGAMDAAAWALAELAWRAMRDPRHGWLIDRERHILAIDLGLEATELGAIATVLRNLHRSSAQPLGQSVREGTQTRGNLWRRAEPEITFLRERLVEAVRGFVAKLPIAEADHPLSACLNGPLELSTGWSIRLGAGGHHISHIHAHGVLSSACHIALPRESKEKEEEGWLELGRPPSDIKLQLPPLASLQPRAGALILFPSFLYHGTRPFQSGERLTVAFDVAPTASLMRLD